MSRIDFSNRPCTGGRRRMLTIVIPAVLLALLTIANGITFAVYRFRNRDIHEQIRVMMQQVEQMEKETRRAAAGLDRLPYKQFQADYRFVRHITRKKALSWSRLFDRMAEVLPATVRLTVISPTVKGDRVLLAISGEALSKQDELAFLDALNRNSAFREPFIEFEQVDSASRNLKFSMTVEYMEGGADVSPH